MTGLVRKATLLSACGLVLAGAAGEADIPMIMSSSSLIPLEDLAREHPHAWFQAYLPGDVDEIKAMVGALDLGDLLKPISDLLDHLRSELEEALRRTADAFNGLVGALPR